MKTGKIIQMSAPETFETDEIERRVMERRLSVATRTGRPVQENDGNNYPGGKNQDGVYQLIINQIPPHDLWIEGCAGSAAITRRIRPALERYIIEVDPVQVRRLDAELAGDIFVIEGDIMERIEPSLDTKDRRFVFIDPPYLKDTMTCNQDIYYKEWTGEDHVAFLMWLNTLDGMVMVTHPRCQLYDQVLESWRRVEYEYMSRGGKRCDCIWMNYPEPKELHDYQYLGKDRTERQSINRLTARWLERFSKLSPLVRRKITSSMEMLNKSEL